MSRTAKYKIIYFAIVFGGAALALSAIFRVRPPVPVLFLAGLLMLVPGRVVGYYWRDLLRGLRLLRLEEFQESKRHSTLFLSSLAAKPHLERFPWFTSSAYSRNARAIALNNLAAAEIRLGEMQDARTHLQAAIDADDQCPLSFFNMGQLVAATDEPEQAASWYERAAVLGYSGNFTDTVMSAAQARYARTDGRGRS